MVPFTMIGCHELRHRSVEVAATTSPGGVDAIGVRIVPHGTSVDVPNFLSGLLRDLARNDASEDVVVKSEGPHARSEVLVLHGSQPRS
jgi:hypothetical protein